MYSMKVVSQKTGLSQHVIRAWERRYQAIVPERTNTNRRLYSDEDIERLSLLAQATSGGHAISNVAKLPTQKLAELVREVPKAVPRHIELPEIHGEPSASHSTIGRCVEAVAALDAEALESILVQTSITHSQPSFIEHVLVPVIHQVGELWEQETLGIAHEHLASSVIRTVLGNMLEAFKVPASAPSLIATTPAGQHHELGALIAAITAASQGWRVTYLGPNLPAEEIAFAAQQNNAKAVALSLVYPAESAELELELRKLRRYLVPQIPLLIGGAAATSYAKVLEAIGAVSITDMSSLRAFLDATNS